tara:strand:- start:50 stop:1348 length:1299 start_codon:yes stop_codon:yes gene_type:complete
MTTIPFYTKKEITFPIENIKDLLYICQDIGENGENSKYYCIPIEIDLDVLFATTDDEIDPVTKDRNYVIPPVHNQRNHVAHAEELEQQYEERGGHVDGVGTDYMIAVPSKDFYVQNEDGIITNRYYKNLARFLNGNTRRFLLLKNPSYRPKNNLGTVRIKSYDNPEDIEKDYKLIDAKPNAQTSRDEIYGALRSHSIHNKVKGIIARGDIARVVKYSVDNKKHSTYRAIGFYKDDYVCLSNIDNYDAAGSIMGKGNSNRPCAITACLMLLAESNREPNTKAIISEIIAEGMVMHDNPDDYWTNLFANFGVANNFSDSSYKKTKLAQYRMTPIQRILYETFFVPDIPEELRVDRSYFGAGAQYQFTGWKSIVSFYLYMMKKAIDTNNRMYKTETRKEGKFVDVFGGSYSYRYDTRHVNSPYNETYKNIFANEG